MTTECVATVAGRPVPVDEVDAAARILDPLLGPLLEAEERADATCAPAYGCFLKDYHPCEW